MWLPVCQRLGHRAFDSGFMHRLTGNRKTVIRGGFGIVYDRINTVQSVIIPMLGVGFAQTISVGAPLCNASGAPGTGCNAAAGTGSREPHRSAWAWTETYRFQRSPR